MRFVVAMINASDIMAKYVLRAAIYVCEIREGEGEEEEQRCWAPLAEDLSA